MRAGVALSYPDTDGKKKEDNIIIFKLPILRSRLVFFQVYKALQSSVVDLPFIHANTREEISQK